MKKAGCAAIAFLLCCGCLAACEKGASIEIRLNDAPVVFHETDKPTDAPFEDFTETDRIPAKVGDRLTITAPGADSIHVEDRLLREDGTCRYNEKTKMDTELASKENEWTYEIPVNNARFYSSDLKESMGLEKELRGIRVVITRGKETQYCQLELELTNG